MTMTPNTPQELIKMNTPTEPTVESVMELMGELNYCQGMEIVKNLLVILRDHHTNVGYHFMSEGEEKKGFIWFKDGVEINTCLNILSNIEME